MVLIAHQSCVVAHQVPLLERVAYQKSNVNHLLPTEVLVQDSRVTHYLNRK